MTDDDVGAGERAQRFVAEVWTDTEAVRERSFADQLSILLGAGSTSNYLVGAIVNGATIVLGAYLYTWLTGELKLVGAAIALLGIWGLISPVVRR